MASFLGGPTALLASFEPVPLGAREAGFTEALNAVSDDSFAVVTNPAGLVLVEKPEFSTTYAQPFASLDDGSRISRAFLSFTRPQPLRFRKAAYAASFFRTSLGGLYAEDTLSGAAAREFGERAILGATGKILRRTYGASADVSRAIQTQTGVTSGGADPLLSSARATTVFTADVGALWKLNNGGRIGAAMRNVTRPDLAAGDDFDPAPVTFDLGWAAQRWGILLAANYSHVRYADRREDALSLGVERWITTRVGLRGGILTGSHERGEGSVGLSYRRFPMQFDYAFGYALSDASGSSGSHILSMTFRFGDQISPIKKSRDFRPTVKNAEPMNPVSVSAPLRREEIVLPMVPMEPNPALTPDVAETYAAVLDAYAAKIKKNEPIEDRAALLEVLFSDFEERGLDTRVIKIEMAALERAEADASRHYSAFWAYYKNSKSGATGRDRTSFLHWLIETFRPTGVDVSEAERELEKNLKNK
ncbi:MAG: hypothetical protein IPP35_02055 [Elusimicrobia bacterium]|nr:hypothetical protein [Elusimicrobiota bacterium]